MFYNSSNSYDYNECVSKGACSISPNVSSIQEVMLLLIRQIAYYIVKLRDFKIIEPTICKDIVYELAGVDAIKDLSEVQMLNAFSKEYNNLVRVRKEYLILCDESGSKQEDLNNIIKLFPRTSLSEILKMGDKEINKNYKKFSLNQKYYLQILSEIIKSVSTNLVCLYNYDKKNDLGINLLLDSLNIYNSKQLKLSVIKKEIELLSNLDVEIIERITYFKKEKFGQIDEVLVSHSTIKNKAILVSGSNLKDLEDLLIAVKNKDIDIYTNGNLLIAHSFPYFRSFKNLKGHFGNGIVSSILDFATFPGAILLTKNETKNIEYLYRGRLFTTDEIPAKGVVKIENKDFSPLIKSAIEAKGFAKGQNRDSELVGYNTLKYEEFLQKILLHNPKRIFIIGISNYTSSQNEYLRKLLESINDNDFVISFSKCKNNKNIFYLNVVNDYSLMLDALGKLFKIIPISSKKYIFYLTKCDIHSLSNIINLKTKGAKCIFLSSCPPNIINPSLLMKFIQIFKINLSTTPKKDLELLNNKKEKQ